MLNSISAFNKTLEKSDKWLIDLMNTANLENKEQAYSVLRSVLHALRDRLLPNEVVHLGSQLPMLIAGMYYQGWKPSATPTTEHNVEEFLESVAEHLKSNQLIDLPLEETTKLVFDFLSQKISPGEMEDVKGMLPKKLQKFLNS